MKPRTIPLSLALIAGTIAPGIAVRFLPLNLPAPVVKYGGSFKLYRSPAIDTFRSTLPGVLLLGKYFSVWDIAAYWVAIFTAAVLDRRMRVRRKVRGLMLGEGFRDASLVRDDSGAR